LQRLFVAAAGEERGGEGDEEECFDATEHERYLVKQG
jgi:hypothetical protein